MQMMLSLLKLQISDNISAEAEHNLKTFEQRIKSMILVQEDLNTNSLVSMISFRAYTAKLADNLTNAYNINSEKIKINIDADDLLLPPEVAIPCGLIINELLTNSVRHAFPQDSEGEISLKISGDSSSFEMIFKDNGNGLAEKNKKTKSSGLGLQLVDTLVSQLGGKMTVLNKTGMEYRINVNTALNNEV
jgi:two-component sensor histidine kinase